MTSEWTTKLLGELCTIFDDGDWIETKDQSPEGIRLIQTGNVGDGTFKDRAEKARYVSEETFKRLRCTEVFPNDCLISRLPDPVGRSCLLPATGERMITAVDCTIVRFRQDIMLPSFFHYYSQSEIYQSAVDRECTGTTRKRISRNRLAKISIPVPPRPEQQRIVAKLDEAFAAIAKAKENAEKNVANARAIFEIELNAIFSKKGEGWEEKRLEEIGKTQTGSTPKTSDQTQYGDFISFVKPADFNADGSLRYEHDGLSKRGLAKARIVPAGSVLMVCIGATIGKCSYCDQDVTTNQQINALTPTDGSSDRFLYYQMRTEAFQQSVIHLAGQATLPIINKSRWSALPIWLPPTVTEQKRIAAKLDALVEETQHLELIYQRKRTELDALQNSLLHYAFNGQL